MEKQRLEAFSDGVLAVAITLLVLDLHIDTRSQEPLADQLRHQWSSFAAFAVSFLVIGVIWVNHHAAFPLAAKVDRVLMFYNLLLMFVTTIPFTTATLANYVHENTPSSRVAVLLYGGARTGIAVGFTLILARITRAGLTHQSDSRLQANRAIRRFGTGCLLYPVITVVGLASPITMLALHAARTTF